MKLNALNAELSFRVWGPMSKMVYVRVNYDIQSKVTFPLNFLHVAARTVLAELKN